MRLLFKGYSAILDLLYGTAYDSLEEGVTKHSAYTMYDIMCKLETSFMLASGTQCLSDLIKLANLYSQKRLIVTLLFMKPLSALVESLRDRFEKFLNE